MRIAIVIGALALAACGPTAEPMQDDVAALEYQNRALREQREAAHTEATEATDAAERAMALAQAASDAADRFQYEDWQNVVGDVQAATSDASTAVMEAHSQASEAADAAAY